MTTSRSPLRVLKAQAAKAAQVLKAMERGERVPDEFGNVAARKGESIKFGIAMDDKIITIEMPWKRIEESGEVALAEFILRQMRGRRETEH